MKRNNLSQWSSGRESVEEQFRNTSLIPRDKQNLNHQQQFLAWRDGAVNYIKYSCLQNQWIDHSNFKFQMKKKSPFSSSLKTLQTRAFEDHLQTPSFEDHVDFAVISVFARYGWSECATLMQSAAHQEQQNVNFFMQSRLFWIPEINLISFCASNRYMVSITNIFVYVSGSICTTHKG